MFSSAKSSFTVQFLFRQHCSVVYCVVLMCTVRYSTTTTLVTMRTVTSRIHVNGSKFLGTLGGAVVDNVATNATTTVTPTATIICTITTNIFVRLLALIVVFSNSDSTVARAFCTVKYTYGLGP